MKRIGHSKNRKGFIYWKILKGSVLFWTVCLVLSTSLAQRPFQKNYGAAEGLNQIECRYVGIDGYTGTLYLSTTGEQIFKYDGNQFTPLTVPYAIQKNIRSFHFVEEGVCLMAIPEVGAQFFRRDGSTFVIYFDKSTKLHKNPHSEQLVFVDEDGVFFKVDWEKERLQPTGLVIDFPKQQDTIFGWQIYPITDHTFYLKQWIGGAHLKASERKHHIYQYHIEGQVATIQPILINRHPLWVLGKDRFLEFKKDYREIYVHQDNQVEQLTLISPMTGQSLVGRFNQLSSINENRQKANTSIFKVEEKVGAVVYAHHFGWDEDKKIISLFSIPTITYNLQTHNFSNTPQYWLPSHEGLFKVNTAITEFSSSHPEMVAALHTITEDELGNIWFGSYGQGFSRYDGQQIKKWNHPLLNKTTVMPGPFQHRNGSNYYFYDTQKGIIKQRQQNWTLIATQTAAKNAAITGYYFRPLQNGKIGLGLYNRGIGIADSLEQPVEKWQFIGKEKGVQLDNVLHLVEDRQQRLWGGRASQGITCYDPQLDTAKTWLLDANNVLSFGSICGWLDPKDNLWLGTLKGLKLIPKVSEQNLFDLDLFQYAKSIPLPGGDNTIVAFMDTIRQYLVVGTQKNIHFLDLEKYHHLGGTPTIYSLKYGEDINGSGSEQNAILVDSKGYLWVGTQTGAARIDMDRLLFDTTSTNLQLTQLFAGDDTLSISEKPYLKLPTGKRNIALQYTTNHNLFLKKNIYYDCLLKKSNGDTLYYTTNTQSNNFDIKYLAPDDYEIEIIARKNNLIADHKQLSFRVPKTLAESNAFWFILALLFSGVVSIAFWIRTRANRKLLEQKIAMEKANREQDKLQIQSIAGALNPHFINNSLHWLSARYRKDSVLTSMIESLSQNILVVFQYTRSGKAFYTLKEEFELVENYLNIHQKQLGETDDINIQLPPANLIEKWGDFPMLIMQLQIHIENAIEHGLNHQRKNKRLVISLEEKAHYLVVQIVDTGIGRIAAKAKNIRGTQQGTKMLQQIIQIYNPYNESKISTIYFDNIFTNSVGEGYGTKVVIKLPKSYQYEIK